MFMKKLITIIIILLIGTTQLVKSQELPDIIPPSPNASSMQVYGNNNVNYYTGAVDITIPIYTIEGDEISLPIYLKYNAVNGVLVEDFASVVGLGWTLNYGGVVSRTINGIADDQVNGYLNYPLPLSISSEESYDFFLECFNGDKDPKPDKFFYNCNNLNGSFILNRDQSATKIPINNDSIITTIDNSSKEITSFEIIDPRGNRYKFGVVEKVSSEFIGAQINNNRVVNNSSWYITSMKNLNNTEGISFSYKENMPDLITFNQSPKSYTMGDAVGTMQLDYSRTYIEQPKRIEEITTTKERVEFIYAGGREDKSGDVYLTQINIYDKSNSEEIIIKKFKFEYEYFTETSNAFINTEAEHPDPLTSEIDPLNYDYGNYGWRLKLKSITEIGSDGTEMEPYEFSYSSTRLPNRLSLGKDHWGYYNGKDENTSLEPEYKVKWRTASSAEGSFNYSVFGDADRDPDTLFTQANILRRILYPTKASAFFEYEQNTARNTEDNQFFGIANDRQSYTLTGIGTDTTTEINSFCSPSITVDITTVQYLKGDCTVRIKFINDDGAYYSMELKEDNFTTSVEVPPGTYTISIDPRDPSGCDEPGLVMVKVSWDNEYIQSDGIVGGVRIKKITSRDGNLDTKNDLNASIASIKEFNYSNGSLVHYPNYGYSYFFYNSYDSYASKILGGYIRTVNSTRPLIYTKGNVVGYSYVEIYSTNTKTGDKTRQNKSYVTSQNYPDEQYGSFTSPGDDIWTTADGITAIHPPLVPFSEFDFARGQLISEVTYKMEGEAYKKIRETKNEYHYFNESQKNLLAINDDQAKGLGYSIMRTGGSYSSTTYFSKRYLIGTGYLLPITSKTYNYFYDSTKTPVNPIKVTPSDTIISETRYYYVDTLENPMSTVLKEEMQLVENDTIEKKYIYLEDKENLVDFDETQNDFHEELRNKNVYIPIETQSLINGVGVQRSRTEYYDFGNLIKPSKILQANYNESLETKAEFLDYNSKGKPLTIKQYNGNLISYVWDSKSIYPKAQITGLEYTDIPVSTINQIQLLNPDYPTDFKNKNDSIRQSLSGTLVNTYTHKPLVGIKTQTDANGNTTYYDYDGFGRLNTIKDNEYNLLKSFEYNIWKEIIPDITDLDAESSFDKIILTWDNIPDVNFNVYKLDNNGNYILVAHGLTSNTYTDTVVQPNSIYNYQVCYYTNDLISERLDKSVCTPPLPVENITGNSTFCKQSIETFTIDSVIGAIEYVWIVTGDALIIDRNDTSITVQFNYENSDWDTSGEISVFSINECGEKSETKVLDYHTIPDILDYKVNEPEGNSIVCPGSVYTYTSRYLSDDVTFNWIVPYGSEIIYGKGTDSIEVEFGSTAGNISVNVSTICGDSSIYKHLSVSKDTLLFLLSHPENHTVCEGESVTFGVSAAIRDTLSYFYQWQLSNDNGLNFSDISGAESRLYTISNPAGENNGNKYRCKVTECGSVYSNVATLTVTSQIANIDSIAGPTEIDPTVIKTYSISNLEGATDYSWTVPSGTEIQSDQDTAISIRTGTAAGYVKVTASNLCFSRSKSKYVKINSVGPTSVTASHLIVGSSCPVTLTVNGGSLGTGAIWVWYTSGCGTDSIGSGNSIIVNPTGNESYYVRAEGDANITDCVSTAIEVLAPDFDLGEGNPTIGDVSSDGGDYTFNIISNVCDWTLDSDELWIRILSFDSSTGDVQIRLLNNNDSYSRTGSFKIIKGGVEEEFLIYQDGRPDIIADFEFTYNVIRSKAFIQFWDLSTGDPDSWAWDFKNDGTINSTLPDPLTTLTLGSHQIKLTVTKDGGSNTIIKSINLVDLGNQ